MSDRNKEPEVAAYPRACAVCGSDDKRPLYRQRFSGLSHQSLLTGYTVSICANCGFGFADDLPKQEVFDTYYREMSKYEQQHTLGGGEADLIRCGTTASALAALVPDTKAAVLDIGCATARTLGLLKNKGFENLLGIDPSRECARLASDLYGVKVLTHTIESMPDWPKRFDAILLVSVVEHIQTLQALVARLAGMLRLGGLLLVEHPDVTRFSASANGPFQEFSTEHINYFSRASLANLLHPHGFDEIHWYQENRLATAGVAVPSSTSIFRIGGRRTEDLVRDEDTERCLTGYIRASQAIEDVVHQRIQELIDARTKFIVWGVGTHTQHLMETTPLPQADIIAFIDSNPRYHGRHLNGIPILAPGTLKNLAHPVLISSMISQNEIFRQLREEIRAENPAILLY